MTEISFCQTDNAQVVLGEHERGVLFRFGRFAGVRGPGRVRRIPGVDHVVVVDLRPQPLEVPGVRATVQVVSPEAAVLRVVDWRQATEQFLQTALNAGVPIDALERTVNEAVADWGVRVHGVEVHEV